MLILDSLHRDRIAAVIKPANVRCDFAEVSLFGLKLKANDIQFPKAFEATARGANVVINYVATENELQIGTYKIFANVS